MASRPFGSAPAWGCVPYDSDEEHFFALSHIRSTTTSDYDPFSLRDEEIDHDAGEATLQESQAKVLEAIGVKAMGAEAKEYSSSVGPQATIRGLPQEYSDDQVYSECDADAWWREGVRAIEEFDWTQSYSEALHSGASRMAPHSAPLSVTPIDSEQYTDAQVSCSGSKEAATMSEYRSKPLRCSEARSTFPSATESASQKASDDGQESSSARTGNSPPEATGHPRTTNSFSPAEAFGSSVFPALLSPSSASAGDLTAPEAMLLDSMDVDPTRPAENIQPVVESDQQDLLQVCLLRIISKNQY